jgi:large conductance mechanosensitive channel
MSIFREFKEYIMKGNALDLAIGVVLGAAFGAVVNGLVKDIIMPPIGMLLGKIDFANIYTQLNKSAVQIAPGTSLAAAQEQGAVVIAWGSFLTAVLTFVIVSFVLFLVVKGVAAAKTAIKKPTEGEVTEKTCPFCQTEIPVKATRCPHCTSQLAN